MEVAQLQLTRCEARERTYAPLRPAYLHQASGRRIDKRRAA
jgi:hypothetical protein